MDIEIVVADERSYMGKAKGKAKGATVRYSDRERELAYALYAITGNVTAVAEKMNIPRSTVDFWVKHFSADGLEDLRRQQKETFIADAWKIIGDAQDIIKRRIQRAIHSEEAIDTLIDEVANIPDEELSRDARKAIVKKLNAISCEEISKLAVVMGTMYDKAALASKEATTIVGGSLTLEDFNDDI